MLMNAGTLQKRAGRSRRGMWVAAITAVAVLLLSVSGFAMWRSYSKQKLLASLGDDPRRVRDAVEEGKITREEARDVFEQAGEARMNKTMDEYFALPTGKEREKYLDKMIDEMEARRRDWQQRAATQPTTRPNRPDRGERPMTQPNDRARRMATRMDSTPPERRAKMAEFRAAMAARMAARGIQGGPGRGGWGGPGGWGGGRGGGGGGGGNRGGGNR